MQKHESLIEAVKAAPPVGVAGLTLGGIPISDVVVLLTGLYTIFLIIDKLPAVFRRARQLASWIKERYVSDQ